MDTVVSYARLLIGCVLLFVGLATLRDPSGFAAGGIALGAIGLAATLHETAYVTARFINAKSLLSGRQAGPRQAPD